MGLVDEAEKTDVLSSPRRAGAAVDMMVKADGGESELLQLQPSSEPGRWDDDSKRVLAWRQLSRG